MCRRCGASRHHTCSFCSLGHHLHLLRTRADVANLLDLDHLLDVADGLLALLHDGLLDHLARGWCLLASVDADLDARAGGGRVSPTAAPLLVLLAADDAAEAAANGLDVLESRCLEHEAT